MASPTVEPFAHELAVDGVTPPWLVFEWYYVEAMAAIKAGEDSLRRVPGIGKARQALRDGQPMNADRYLKTPEVFGVHGVYKRLARHLDIADESLDVGEHGHRLLEVWETEQGGQAGETVRGGPWPGATFFAEHLMPGNAGRREGEFLRQLFTAGEGETT